MNYVTEEFAPLLYEYMKLADLTDETLAEQINVTDMTIRNWRTGKIKHPSPKKILKCADVLKLTPLQRTKFLTAAGLLDVVAPPPLVPVVGVPIIEPYQFFGREKVLRKIFWAWNKTVLQHIAIIGPKRSGKTSILHYLKKITGATYLRPEQPQGWPKGWLPHYLHWVLVDFQNATMSQPETLIKHILRQLHLEEPPTCDIPTFSNMIEDELDKPAVILMDDIKMGLEAPALDQPFWWNLRSLGSHGKLCFVVTATQSPVELAREFGKPSPFFNIFSHIIPLDAFTESEARELLKNSPKSFTQQEIETMLTDSDCWPDPLQKLCDARLQELML
jgi:transcriptional regulator with XRE-family HTH domain